MLTSLEPAGKNFNVGKDSIETSDNSLAVESILAMMTLSLSSNFSANLSQVGAKTIKDCQL